MVKKTFSKYMLKDIKFISWITIPVWLIGFLLCIVFLIEDFNPLMIPMLLIFIIPAIVIFFLRKLMFSKILISEDVIAYTYKNKIFKQLRWEEINTIFINGTTVHFSKLKYENYIWDKQDITFLIKLNEVEDACKVIAQYKLKYDINVIFYHTSNEICTLLKK